jgi:hypothetical protein
MHLSFFLSWQKFIGIIRDYLLWTTANSKRETLIEGLWSKLSERSCHMLHINTYTYVHTYMQLCVYMWIHIHLYAYTSMAVDTEIIYIYIIHIYIIFLIREHMILHFKWKKWCDPRVISLDIFIEDEGWLELEFSGKPFFCKKRKTGSVCALVFDCLFSIWKAMSSVLSTTNNNW